MVYRNSISGLSSHAGKATALLGTYWPWTVGGTRGTAPRGLRAEPQPILPLPSPSWLLISCLSPRQPPVFRRGFIYVEADAYSSRVHHPVFMGTIGKGSLCRSCPPRPEQRTRMSPLPSTRVPPQSTAAARATYIETMTQQSTGHCAHRPKYSRNQFVNSFYQLQHCESITGWHNFRDESESTCLESQTDVT